MSLLVWWLWWLLLRCLVLIAYTWTRKNRLKLMKGTGVLFKMKWYKKWNSIKVHLLDCHHPLKFAVSSSSLLSIKIVTIYCQIPSRLIADDRLFSIQSYLRQQKESSGGTSCEWIVALPQTSLVIRQRKLRRRRWCKERKSWEKRGRDWYQLWFLKPLTLFISFFYFLSPMKEAKNQRRLFSTKKK